MGFDEFRHGLETWGQQQLNVERPAYVGAFKAELIRSANLESAMNAAEPFLDKPLSWAHLLTCALDVEMARDKLKFATVLSGANPPDQNIPRGVWVVHQADLWSLCASAFLERIDKLVFSTCRKMIKDPARRKKVVDSLKDAIEKQKGHIKILRDRVAHGGGGPVEAMESERLWEVHLVLEVDGFRDVINNFHEYCADRQSGWHDGFSDVTLKLIADADTWFDQLAKDVF
jgi:hypothetical protein